MPGTPPNESETKARFSLALVALCAVAGTVLGVHGYLQTQGVDGAGVSPSTAIYQTFQLFLWNGSTVPEPVPWSLQAARFLCGFSSVGVVAFLILSRVGRRLKAWGNRLRGGHTVVIGVSPLVVSLVESPQRQEIRFTLVVPRHRVEAAMELGLIPGRIGDPHSRSILLSVGVRRASSILVLDEDDGFNLEVAACLNGVGSLPERQTRKVLVSNPDARASLDVGERFLAGVEVILQNLERQDARLFFDRHPPDFLPLPRSTAAGRPRKATLVVFGAGARTIELILQAGRIGHFASGAPTRVLVCTQDEGAESALLEATFGVQDAVQLEFLTSESGKAGWREPLIEELAAHRLGDPLTVAVVHDGTVSDRLGTGLWVQDLMETPREDVRIVVDVGHAAGVAGLMGGEDFRGDHPNVLSFLRSSPAACLASDKDMDLLASRFHEEYLRSREVSRFAQPDNPLRPAERPWKHLGETYRDASRALADHLPVKLRAIGLRIVDEDSVPSGTAVNLTDEEVELLARLEHVRWCAERRLAGWSYGTTRDSTRLRHELLVPWEELSEQDRYLDRDVVKNAQRVLSSTGRVIVRFV